MPVTYEEIWEKEFKPRIGDTQRRETERQTEAFLDFALTLAGEPVRQMTQSDMLHLDAMANPFIAGAPDGQVHFLDCAGFIWELSVANNHTASLGNLWRRSRLARRLAWLDLGAMVAEISAYVDRMLLDDALEQTSGQKARDQRDDIFAEPPKTHFLVPLLMKVAAEIGPHDPVSGQLLADIPLPRLIQYGRHIDSKEGGPKHYTALHSLRNKCQDRVNQLNWAERNPPPANVAADVPA